MKNWNGIEVGTLRAAQALRTLARSARPEEAERDRT